MGEKQTRINTQEKTVNNERLQEIAHKRQEELRDKLDQAERSHKDAVSEKEALSAARELAKDNEDKDKRPVIPAERRRGVLTKKQLSHAYELQLEQAREHMSPAGKLISKIIHNRTVETVSDTIASTVARPNALLSGSIAAFTVVTLLYFIAKHYGYQLSGFETIGAFIAGWVLGILFDYFALLIRGR